MKARTLDVVYAAPSSPEAGSLDHGLGKIASPGSCLRNEVVLEDARAVAAYGQHSSIEIHQELPGRIHIVLIRQVTGF